MQLFSIGVYEMNMDGTYKLDGSGLPILTYDNTDIQNFARVWTGFTRQTIWANLEFWYMKTILRNINHHADRSDI